MGAVSFSHTTRAKAPSVPELRCRTGVITATRVYCPPPIHCTPQHFWYSMFTDGSVIANASGTYWASCSSSVR